MIDEILEADGNIYQTIMPNGRESFRYRLLTLKEYKVHRLLIDNSILSEEDCFMKVFERCFLGQSFLLSDDLPAGILISIGRLIMWMSGDSDGQTLIHDIERHKAMNPTTSVYAYMQAAILTAMPSYTVESLENWDREKLLKIFTISENVLEKQREGYTRLALEIQEPGKRKKPAHGIDFEKENRAIRKHQNPMDIEQTEQNLNKEQLQKLERMRR